MARVRFCDRVSFEVLLEPFKLGETRWTLGTKVRILDKESSRLRLIFPYDEDTIDLSIKYLFA
jgi:hypothetical protein